MFALFFFLLAVIFTLGSLFSRRDWSLTSIAEVSLSYLLLFNVGIVAIIAAVGHIFYGPEVAAQIGWAPGSPFQYEMGVSNLSYGVLGVASFWVRGRFWDATVIGISILFLGCFVGHMIDLKLHGNDAPYNAGPYIWFNDLALPLVLLGLLLCLRRAKGSR